METYVRDLNTAKSEPRGRELGKPSRRRGTEEVVKEE
jgi:hypothetical protein